MKIRRSAIRILILLALTGCDLFKKSVEQTEQLPPATQEGKNTFGCLVNGKVWLPKGNNGTANLDASYDPDFAGGSLSIYSYTFANAIVDQFMAFGGINIATPGNYPLSTNSNSPSANFNDQLTGCTYDEPQNILSGSFTITKLDVANGIISGTFEFAFSKADCETINITQGRFDIKL